MKMVAVNFEIVRATSAVAEFLVHVELDGPVEEYAVTGHSVGPQCPVASTIEVSYPLTEMERRLLRSRSFVSTPATGSVNVTAIRVSERSVTNGAGSMVATAGASVSGVV